MSRFKLSRSTQMIASGVLLSLSMSGCPAGNQALNNLPPAVKDLLSSVTAAAGEVAVTGKIDPGILTGFENAAIRLIGPGGPILVKPNLKGEFILRMKIPTGLNTQSSSRSGAGTLFRIDLVQLAAQAAGQAPAVLKVYARLELPTGIFNGAAVFSPMFPVKAGTVIALKTIGPRPGSAPASAVAEWTSENNPLATWDSDQDGTPDATDLDDDGDRAPDDRDLGPMAYDPTEHHDLDGDGTGDNADLDDDNDGAFDWLDADDDNDGTADTSDTDDNGDGYADLGDTTAPEFLTRHDLDHDGLADEVDPDDDGDGTGDVADTDDDGDGTADASDADDDNDGILDDRDAADGDDDGVADAYDEAPSDAGTTDLVADFEEDLEADQDLDGIANAEDTDDDGDGTPDGADTDADNDGVANAEDLDDDGNGVPDVAGEEASSAEPEVVTTPEEAA
jgi:hypothetical protein